MIYSQKDDPIQLLNKTSYKTVVMKMKAPYLNQLFKCCCYTQENVYKLYKWIPNDTQLDISNGKSGKRILKVKEKSSMPMRCFVPSSCRGYECQFQAENNRRVIFSMSRPAKCTMLCISRPEISVYYLNAQKQKQLLKNEDQSEMVELDQFQDHLKSYQEEKEGKRELIGRAYLPFSFCGTSIIIYDENNLPIYQIFGTSWQCQLFFFPTPCGPCRDSVWIIADFKSTIEDPIGHIYKRWSNCFKQCMSTAPWYVIDFPENIDWKRKLLILSAVQLLDQHYFSGTCK